MKCKKNSKVLVVVAVFLVYGQISRGEYDGKFFVYLRQICLAQSLNRKCKFMQSEDLICGKKNSYSKIKYQYIEISLLFLRTPRIDRFRLSAADRVYYLRAGLLGK